MCIAVVYFIYLLSISMSVLSLSFMSNFICLVMGLGVLVAGGSPMQEVSVWHGAWSAPPVVGLNGASALPHIIALSHHRLA